MGHPPRERSTITAGTPTAATAQRIASSLMVATRPRASTSPRLDAPEASIAPLVVEDRLEEVLAVEVGPVHGRDVELRVRELPEHEVADAILPGRANQQIRRRERAREQRVLEHVLVDVLGADLAAPDALRQDARRAHELFASAVRD